MVCIRLSQAQRKFARHAKRPSAVSSSRDGVFFPNARRAAKRPVPFFVRQACCVSGRCKSSAGRDDRNRKARQGCPPTRRNLKEADAINSDSTNRNRIQGRRGGVIRQWTEMPNSHPDAHAGKSGERRAKEAQLIPGRSPRPSGRAGLPRRQRRGKDLGEVSRGRSSSPVHAADRKIKSVGRSNHASEGRMKGRIFLAKESVGDDSMGAERQQGRPYQRLLFPELEEGLRPGSPGEGGTGSGTFEESQTPAASDPPRALTERLMEEVCQPDNVNQTYRRVKANQGAPGVDGMTIDELPSWLAAHQQEFLANSTRS